MKKKLLLFTFLTLNISFVSARHPVHNVKKVIIWAYKLHSDTFGWIHWAYNRTFKHLGFDTYWVDDTDKLSNFDFSNSLFITMGATANHKMPIRDDCFYIIHNGDASKFKHLVDKGRCIFLQVYTHDCLKRNDEKFSYCFHYSLKDSTIYMPWATDLLPHEIDKNKELILKTKKRKNAIFIGSLVRGGHGNINQINDFKSQCKKYGLSFNPTFGVEMKDNMRMVREATLAPAIQGTWQCKNGYVPCRIFKNISYGALGITNSETVYKLFDKKIVYNPNPKNLVDDAMTRLKTTTNQELFELMDYVRDNHTYIQRIERLLNFFEMVSNHKGITY